MSLSTRRFTEILAPITQPTSVVLEPQPQDGPAEPHRHDPRLLAALRWGGLAVVAIGIIVSVPMWVIKFIPGLIVGTLLVSGGWCVVTLELLLTPERPSLDRKVWDRAVAWWRA